MLSHSHKIIEKILNSSLTNDSPTQDSQTLINEQEPIEMVIQLDSNTSATIQIYPNDDPFILAKTFCFQYSIDPRVINTLANNIKNVKNLQFNQQSSQEKISRYSDHNKSKISNSAADKQNNSSFMNASHSINESFNKGNSSQKFKTLDKSSNLKNDTTIISHNDFSRRSVFDRLYQDSKRKKTSKNAPEESTKKNKKMSQSILQSSHISSDPCLQIYEKNTKAYQSALQKRQQMYKQNQQKIIQQCSFHPQINQISEIIARKLPQHYPSQRKREKDIKRIQKYLEEKQKKQLAQCTFEPSILRKSRSRSKSTERYNVLYEDSKIRQMKRKKSLNELQKSRKKSAVKINKISQCIVGNRTFFERLKQDQYRRQQKKAQIQYEIKQSTKRLPSTGRAPTNRPQNISIGQHLYNQAVKKSLQKQKQNPMKLSKLTCKKSQEIYQNTKKTAFQYIFALLDSDEDGLISNTRINLSRLPGEILRLLAPLLIEMEDMKAELDETQFVEALQRLFNSFSVAERQIVLSVFKFKNKPLQDSHSFKPQLNEKSLMWARENRPDKMDLYQLWKQTESEKQQRLQEIRAYKVLSQLEQCTFHPLLFR